MIQYILSTILAGTLTVATTAAAINFTTDTLENAGLARTMQEHADKLTIAFSAILDGADATEAAMAAGLDPTTLVTPDGPKVAVVFRMPEVACRTGVKATQGIVIEDADGVRSTQGRALPTSGTVCLEDGDDSLYVQVLQDLTAEIARVNALVDNS